MHLSLAPLALSVLSLTSSAAAMPRAAFRMPERTSNPTNPALLWHVSDFGVGCSPGGCVYGFNIYGVASDNTPGFNTTCNGTSNQDHYAPCQGKGILSQIEPSSSRNWTVSVQHQWREGMFSEFYAMGEKNVTSNTTMFTIPVQNVYGVA